MIFRLDGSIEETLALTPAMKEWKEATSDLVWADTLYPELFVGNPYVDGVINEKVKGHCVTDFNNVSWQSSIRPVSDSFSEFLMGKRKRQSWRTIMKHSVEQEDVAMGIIGGRSNVVVVSEGMDVGVDDVLAKNGWSVVRMSGKKGLLGVYQAVVSMACLYIGVDGDDTAIALTTDTPAVVAYTCRNPVYFSPFRRGIPFEAIVPDKNICEVFDSCLSVNGLFENGKTYGVKCPKKEISCKEWVTVECVVKAVARLLEKA